MSFVRILLFFCLSIRLIVPFFVSTRGYICCTRMSCHFGFVLLQLLLIVLPGEFFTVFSSTFALISYCPAVDWDSNFLNNGVE